MSENTPIPASDPFRTSRITAAVLSLLTLCMVGVLGAALIFRPSAQGHRAALRRFFLSIDPPLIAMQTIAPYPPPWSLSGARMDWRFSPQAPAAVIGTTLGSALRRPPGRPQ